MDQILTFFKDPTVHGALVVIGLVILRDYWPTLKAKIDAYKAKKTNALVDSLINVLEPLIDNKVAAATQAPATSTTATTAGN